MKNKIIVISIFLALGILPVQVLAAIAFDKTLFLGSGDYTTFITPFTIENNPNRILFVANYGSEMLNDAITGITYAGIPMTKISSLNSNPPANGRWFSYWYLLNPAIGTNNIVITNSSFDRIRAVAASYFGVKQQTPEAINIQNYFGHTFSIPIDTLTSNAWVLGYIGTTSYYPQTSINTIFENNTPNGGTGFVPIQQYMLYRSSLSPITTPTSTSLNWTYNSITSLRWAGTIISIAEAPAEAPARIPIIGISSSTPVSDFMAYIGKLFTDLWKIIALATGLPLGFYIVRKVISVIKK